MTEVESMLEWLRDEGLLVETDRKLLEEFRAHHQDAVMKETRDALEDAGCVAAVVVDRDVVGRIVLDDLKNQMLAKGMKPVPGKTLRPFRAVVTTPVTVGIREEDIENGTDG
jgi:hypothetical protein